MLLTVMSMWRDQVAGREADANRSFLVPAVSRREIHDLVLIA